VSRAVDFKGSTVANTTVRRIDLAAVHTSLRSLQRDWYEAVGSLSVARDPLDDRVVDNMLAGYSFIDALVTSRIDVLAPGNLKHLLEMNSLVLCGTSPARREDYRRHIQATEHRFYEEREGGVQDLVEWYAMHRDDAVWSRAAGAYVRMLSRPQLFIEGNHRTGALLMSFILVGSGRPPFVLSADAAPAYFDPSVSISHVDKKNPTTYFQLSRVRDRLATLLVEHSDPRHLLATS
jgi:hypothetical protein